MFDQVYLNKIKLNALTSLFSSELIWFVQVRVLNICIVLFLFYQSKKVMKLTCFHLISLKY